MSDEKRMERLQRALNKLCRKHGVLLKCDDLSTMWVYDENGREFGALSEAG